MRDCAEQDHYIQSIYEPCTKEIPSLTLKYTDSTNEQIKNRLYGGIKAIRSQHLCRHR